MNSYEIEEMYSGDVELTSAPKRKTYDTCGIINYDLHINTGFQLMLRSAKASPFKKRL